MATSDEWTKSSEFLRSSGVDAALHVARVLDEGAARWSQRVVSRTSMHDLLFTLPGDDYPFASEVRVSWNGEAFEYTLLRRRLLVTADKCHEERASQVLDAFLEQLLAEG